MNCPNCQGQLHPTSYEGLKIESCTSCGGEWLDADELHTVVNRRRERFTREERRAIVESTTITGVELENVDRDLACPKCGGTTDPINYGGDSGIIIDRCTSCRGFWLDATEMEKVQMLIEGWDDALPDDLEEYGPKLRQIALEMDQADNVNVAKKMPGSRLVNASINGILDLTM